MILFHGSLESISQPEIRQPNRTLDYDAGFYATTSQQQAEDWVKRRMRESYATIGFVNEYNLNGDVLKKLKCLVRSIKEKL